MADRFVPRYQGPTPAMCGWPADGEGFVERCDEVPDAEAALQRLAGQVSNLRDWVVVGTRWLYYDFEDTWDAVSPGKGAERREFWHLTWRTGPTY